MSNPILRRLQRVNNYLRGSDQEALRFFLRRIDSRVSGRLLCSYNKLFGKLVEYREIPIIINNFNRLDCLRRLMSWLDRAQMKNVTIIDNGSTYRPLIDYYSRSDCDVIRVNNRGPLALWTVPSLWHRIRNNFYVYTDVDVVPDDVCPLDAVNFLREELLKHPAFEKIGLGLRLDDLPDCYEKKADVLGWEKQYWSDRFDSRLFRARVDTTFALYRPRAIGGWWLNSLRTDFPYVAQHLPWYQDSSQLSNEELFYRKHVKPNVSTWIEARGSFGSLDSLGNP